MSTELSIFHHEQYEAVCGNLLMDMTFSQIVKSLFIIGNKGRKLISFSHDITFPWGCKMI